MFYSGLQKQRLSPWGQKDPLLRHFANSWPFVGLDEERRACDLQEGRRSERRCPARKPSLLTRAASLSTCHSPGSLPTSSCASVSCPEALPRAKLQLREASKSAYHQAPALLQAPARLQTDPALSHCLPLPSPLCCRAAAERRALARAATRVWVHLRLWGKCELGAVDQGGVRCPTVTSAHVTVGLHGPTLPTSPPVLPPARLLATSVGGCAGHGGGCPHRPLPAVQGKPKHHADPPWDLCSAV